MTNTFHSFEVQDATGKQVSLEQYKGKVVLVVNVASKCGFTPQYTGLEALYEKYQERGFVVLGFPCNQFGAQEAGSDQEIQQFCSLTYNVKFPVFAKVDVNGEKAAPVFNWLKVNASGLLGTEAIKWNFTKFLIDQNGKVLKRYAPQTEPVDISKDIESLLK